MTQRIFVDRSRYESAQRCQRARWYGYHQNGVGIQSQRQPLPLAVGGSVHKGLATLLELGGSDWNKDNPARWELAESQAVATALTDFAQYQHALDAPDAEAAILDITDAAAGLSGLINPENIGTRPSVRNEFDEYLFREQSALVEAMVRAYARRRLRPLLDQFEVLEVEREGEWELSPGATAPHMHPHMMQVCVDPTCPDNQPAIWFMSRPDALLRDRESNQLYLLSYKTTGSWDIRKARDAEHDMQGMSEGIEIERRLAEWWKVAQSVPAPWSRKMGLQDGDIVIPSAMADYLRALDAPPRILAVRMEYLLKGERWKDKELSARFGVEMRSQKSHLIRAYEAVSVPMRGAAGYNIGDLCWSWEYIRDDGRESTLAWQNWKSRPVFDSIAGGVSVKSWINMLDDAAETMSGEDSTMGMPPRLLGYKCDAQSVGLTAQHPLDVVFIPPITCYRNEDDLRDLVEQMESSERRIAEGVAQVEAATEDGERRHLLNTFFPQTRRACEYPTSCAFVSICYGGEDIRKNPLDSGRYKARIPNHPQEDYNSVKKVQP